MVLGRIRIEDHSEFDASLCYIRPCFTMNEINKIRINEGILEIPGWKTKSDLSKQEAKYFNAMKVFPYLMILMYDIYWLCSVELMTPFLCV